MKTTLLIAGMLMGASAMAQYLSLKDFEDQSVTSGGWTTQVVIAPPTSSPGDWSTSNQGASSDGYYGKATGWNGSAAEDSEMWLISPAMDLSSATQPTLNFTNAVNFNGPALELWISTDYDGSSDPTAQGTWTDISGSVSWSAGSFAWTPSGDVDLTAYSGAGNTDVYFAYKYTSTTAAGAATWEVDNITVDEYTAPSTTSIYDIQFTTNPSGDSPEDGNVVMTGGIVTAHHANGYYIQAGTGPFSGVYVQDNMNAVSRGDSVTLSATVNEFFNFTRLENVTGFTVVSSGNNEPAATNIVNTGDVNAEQYEGVKVMTTGEVTNDNYGFGMFQIFDNSTDSTLVDDVIYQYIATNGQVLQVTGVVEYSFSEYKILPRDANDITDVTSVEELIRVNLEVYPTITSTFVTVEASNNAAYQVVDMTGKIVQSGSLLNGFNTINLESLSTGIYFIKANNAPTVKVMKQ
jgi:DNA/RNA endonuclease YhcR with UshA esterase domain